jgi:hypothetical protein
MKAIILMTNRALGTWFGPVIMGVRFPEQFIGYINPEGETTMKTLSTVAFGSMFLAVTAFMCEPSDAAGYKAAASEIALLPKFCYGQYVDGVSGPEYYLPSDSCGPGMNHYCPALVAFIRAKRSSGGSRERMKQLSIARTDVIYTLKWMEPYPACQIRSHVEATLKEIDFQMKIYGKK